MREASASRGLLVVFEGIDGAGKSTQIKLIQRWLEKRGHRVLVTSWNSWPPLARLTKRAKKARALTPLPFSLLHAAELWQRVQTEIVPALEAGSVVIADRYLYTGLARDTSRGVHRGWVAALYGGLPEPDLVLSCQIEVRQALERVQRKGNGPSFYEAGLDVAVCSDPEESFLSFQEKVAAHYRRLSAREGWVEIDLSGPVCACHRHVVNALRKALYHPRQEADVFPGALRSDARANTNGYTGRLVVVEGGSSRRRATAQTLYWWVRSQGYPCRLVVLEDGWIFSRTLARSKVCELLGPRSTELVAAASSAQQWESDVLPGLRAGEVVIVAGYVEGMRSEVEERGGDGARFTETVEPHLPSAHLEMRVSAWAAGTVELRTVLAREILRRMPRPRRPGPVTEICRELSASGLGGHSLRVERFALELFDQLQPMHGCEARDRELLGHAALLHDLGRRDGERNHCARTYELVSGLTLSGLEPRERRLVSAVAGLHGPRWGREELQRLAGLRWRDQLLARKLAAILRLADAADAQGRPEVIGLRATAADGGVVVDLICVGKGKPEKEAILGKAELFERTFGVPLLVDANLFLEHEESVRAPRPSKREIALVAPGRICHQVS